MQGLQVMTLELTTLQGLLATGIPLPNLAHYVAHLLTKMSADDNVDAFLGRSERTTAREGWPHGEWTWLLSPLLTGKAERRRSLSSPENRDPGLLQLIPKQSCRQLPLLKFLA